MVPTVGDAEKVTEPVGKLPDPETTALKVVAAGWP